MEKDERTVAQRVAQAAVAFEKKRTGHAPHSITVVMGGDTLVITLHGALTQAEQAMAATAKGAAELTVFHRELFDSAAASFRQEIKVITGVDVKESKTKVDTTTGTVVQVFTTGTTVQVYLLSKDVLAETWSQDEQGNKTSLNGRVSNASFHPTDWR